MGCLSKYKLWKTLHELGFKYAKINRNKKALAERKDLVNKRINCLHTIKQKRNEGYKPSSCKVFQSLYFDTFKECFFSKVTHNFLIETYSFFKKNANY
jgi:hypothetical protein